MTDLGRGRRFGFSIAAVCALVGLCRRRPVPLALAAAFAASAVLAPGFLSSLERRLARINAAIVLTITYYLAVTPFALVWRLLGGDPLDLRARRESYWRPVEPRAGYDKPF